MAAASYNTDLADLTTTPDSGETTSNWNALGGGASGLNVETDYFLQGANCLSKNAWAGAEKGMIEDTTNNTLSTGSGKAVYTWVTHLTPGSLAVKASGGICILLGSTAAVYNEYDYAGSDTIDYGAPWICAVVDPDNATATTGTVTTANMDCYGATANLPVGGPTKGAPFAIDVIRYGRSIEINDGVGAAANFTDMAVQNDLVANRWGQFQRTPGSTTNFTMQCRIEFGDTTNTTACVFTDSNKNITINDLDYTATGFIEFDVTQASTVSLTNVNFTAVSGANTRGNWKTTSATSVTLTSCSFTNMGTFGFDSTVTADLCTFRGTDLVTSGGADISNSLFDGSTAASAVTVTNLNELDKCNFVIGTTGHAVELTGAAGTYSWDNTATGYDTGTTGNGVQVTGASITGDEHIHITATTGTFIINVAAGATTPSVSSAGAIVNVLVGQRTFTFTVSPSITGYEWRIYEDSGTAGVIGTVELDGEETATADNQSYIYTYTADKDIVVQIIASGYEEALHYDTLTDADKSVTILLETEENT